MPRLTFGLPFVAVPSGPVTLTSAKFGSTFSLKVSTTSVAVFTVAPSFGDMAVSRECVGRAAARVCPSAAMLGPAAGMRAVIALRRTVAVRVARRCDEGNGRWCTAGSRASCGVDEGWHLEDDSGRIVKDDGSQGWRVALPSKVRAKASIGIVHAVRGKARQPLAGDSLLCKDAVRRAVRGLVAGREVECPKCRCGVVWDQLSSATRSRGAFGAAGSDVEPALCGSPPALGGELTHCSAEALN